MTHLKFPNDLYILQGTLEWFKLPPTSQDVYIFTTNSGLILLELVTRKLQTDTNEQRMLASDTCIYTGGTSW